MQHLWNGESTRSESGQRMLFHTYCGEWVGADCAVTLEEHLEPGHHQHSVDCAACILIHFESTWSQDTTNTASTVPPASRKQG